MFSGVPSGGVDIAKRLRILFALPGLHRVQRGAEVAFESLAQELSQRPDCEVTLIGSGRHNAQRGYQFLHAGCIARERFLRWPRLPLLRSQFMYEELTFVPGLLKAYRPEEYDITVTCSFPYTNWSLLKRSRKGYRPAHIFVTENGDWAPRTTNAEYRWFSCDGLVCTNAEYFERHQQRWRSCLIPNGVDIDRFAPGEADRHQLKLTTKLPIVLMVSALVPSKRVLEGIRFVSSLKNIALIVAGDGPLAEQADGLGRDLMGDRYQRVVLASGLMPDLYRAASVLLHMSQTEPFGNIYLEALATGMPVVADDNAKTRWIVEDQAFLVDTSNPEAVQTALTKALKQSSPEQSYTRRALIKRRYTWPIVAASYYDFFCEIYESAQPSCTRYNP